MKRSASSSQTRRLPTRLSNRTVRPSSAATGGSKVRTKKGLRDTDPLDRLPDDARPQRREIQLDVRQFRHCAKIPAMMVIGTQFYPADPDGERRQVQSRASLLALGDVIPVNLQFVDETYEPAGFTTLPVLRQDSRAITGVTEGVRKPIVSEMFDALAGVATAERCRYFAYLNNDVVVTPAALDRVRQQDADGFAISRVDVNPATGAELGVQIFGLDMFVIDAAWWLRERRRFRPYIAGEMAWDDVYASIICAHGRGEIVNERPGILHDVHPTLWKGGPFAEHNGFLAALDAPYFSRWVQYATRLDQAIKAGRTVDRRQLAQETMGDARLSARAAVRHAASQLLARVRYARRRAAASRRRSPRRSGAAAS